MAKTQVQFNKQSEGGFLGTLLAEVASAVLPSVVKVKQLGNGLYLRPYKTDAISDEGLFMRVGQGYEQIKDHTINGAAAINELLK
jgi:hypothetical protein